MRPGPPVLAVLLGAAALGACSDLATSPDRAPAALRVAPDTARLVEGDAVTFTLEVLDRDGVPYAVLPAWAPPLWTSSRPELLEVDAAGRGVARRPGASWARVELAGLTTQALVRTNPRAMDLAVPFAYITQSVQRQGGGVPLVAGRPGLLRVYVAGTHPNFFRPQVRATFHRAGAVVHTETLTLEHAGVPEDVDEGDLRLSYDAVIPGSVFRPGLGLVLEVDPGGVVPVGPASTLRVPAEGELPLQVVEVPPFRLRLVPVDQSAVGVESTLSPARADRVTGLTGDIFPLAELDVDVRERYATAARLSTEQGWYDLIQEIAMLRLDDGSDRYYYGGFQRIPGTTFLGIGYIGYPVAIGVDDRDDTIAHEIGHNLGLPHAPCGDPSGADPRYPYPDGFVGRYGYDRARGVLLDPYRTYDLMSYCDPIWISDYNYERVLAYRDTSRFDAAFEVPETGAAAPPRRATLVVRGGVLDGAPRLEPALEWDAPVTPPAPGPYTLEGLDAAGRTLFTVAVAPRPLDHGSGSTFLVSLPVEQTRPDRLRTLRLSGPEGTVERVRTDRSARAPAELVVERRSGRFLAPGRWDPDAFPLAVVRDRATGTILAMSRTGRIAVPGDPARVEVLFSDGIGTRSGRVVRR